jgi:translation initiation factor 3 subunit H
MLTESVRSSAGDVRSGEAYQTGVTPSYTALDLETAGMTRNLEQIVEAIDSYRTEEGNVSYLIRQIARERAKADSYVAKRKEENQTRIAQGLAPLPEEDVTRLFKIPTEPSRLESTLLLGQIDAYGKSLGDTSSSSLVKMYAARASAGI